MIKHAAAVGVWVGPTGSVAVLILASVIGGFGVPMLRMVRGKTIRGDVNFGPIYAAVSAVVFLVAQIPENTLPWDFLKVLR